MKKNGTLEQLCTGNFYRILDVKKTVVKLAYFDVEDWSPYEDEKLGKPFTVKLTKSGKAYIPDNWGKPQELVPSKWCNPNEIFK